MKTAVILSKTAIQPSTRADGLENNKEVIKQYLIAAGEGIELTEKQKELLMRWEFADETIRTNMGKISRGEIANIIATRWDISQATAKSDMTCAEDVMSSSNPLNKKHRFALRVEFLEKQSRLAAAANNFDAVAKIEKSIAFYLDRYPDTIAARARPQIVYNIQQNILNNNSVPEEEADQILEAEIKRLEEDEDDTD
jgi:hypothetical protein